MPETNKQPVENQISKDVEKKTAENLQNLQDEVSKTNKPKITEHLGELEEKIGHQRQYESMGQTGWDVLFGRTREKAMQNIEYKDPITGGPITFLGKRIGGGINYAILPYLKEAETKIKKAGINYKVRNTSATNWRKKRGRKTRSLHSWGVAIDINPATNPLGSTETDFPPEFIQIMKSVGFRWGGDFTRRKDPMHFEFKYNPFTSKDLIKTEEGKKYLQSIEQKRRVKFKEATIGPVSGKQKQQIKSQQSDITNSAQYKERRKNNKEISSADIKKIIDELFPSLKDKHPILYTLLTSITDLFGKSNAKKNKKGETINKTEVKTRLKGIKHYLPLINKSAEKYGVPASLIARVMMTESGGDPYAASPVGAGGLMQFMPQTAKAFGLKTYPLKGRKLDPRDDRANPEKIIPAGARLLANLLKRYGSTEKALMAYNGGGRAVKRFERGGYKALPRETKNYVCKILKNEACA